MDRARRKELQRQYKSSEHAAARHTLLLTRKQLHSLLAALKEVDAEDVCDHTQRLARGWASERGLDAVAVGKSLAEHGGYCDCEVLANVTPDKFGWPED
jgi:hypothetical protein